MIIITYSETTAETIEQRIGKAEYSYYFIYKKYLPAMERLGRLISVQDPETEVDRIYRDNPDEECIFFSFSPPHRTVLDLECPTVCIFAWEFSTIPDDPDYDDPEYNWAGILRQLGNALTISEYAAEVVHKQIPEDINLVVLPAAVNTVDPQALTPKSQSAAMDVKATLYDSRAYKLSPDMIDDTVRGSRDPLSMQPWDDEPIALDFGEDNIDSIELLVGFYSAEVWGAWSRTKAPWIMLPHNVSGPVSIELELFAFGSNIDRDIDVRLGNEVVTIKPGAESDVYTLNFNPAEEVDLLKFSNLDLTHAPGSRDHRSLGIGVKTLRMQRPEDYKKKGSNPIAAMLKGALSFLSGKFSSAGKIQGNFLELDGIVYTSVLNPQDGRKNWSDMVTAFCWAFRDNENATLVLKMTHHNLTTFLGKLLLLYSQMSPFKCRVVAVHGFLTDEQYQLLMDKTHYVVNTSHCEGQCLPLMEFMGQGIPAIAPKHTAMLDYVTEDNTFVVNSNQNPTFWPIDERKVLRTLCYRLDWYSLMERYRESFDVVSTKPEVYERMRRCSIESIENCAGQERVYRDMQRYLEHTARKSSAAIAEGGARLDQRAMEIDGTK